jgi:hypothetical protein
MTQKYSTNALTSLAPSSELVLVAPATAPACNDHSDFWIKGSI